MMLEPMYLMRSILQYIFFHCSLIFRQALPEPLRGMVSMLHIRNALVITPITYDQCSPIFRRTQLEEPEPLRGRVMLFSHNILRCFAYVQLHQCDPIFRWTLLAELGPLRERTAFYCLGDVPCLGRCL